MCLSATVSNAEEVAAWIETVRGAPRRSSRRPGRSRSSTATWWGSGAATSCTSCRRSSPRRTANCDPTPTRPGSTPATRATRAGGDGPAPACAPRAGSRPSSCSRPRRCCPRSRSSSAARAATRPSSSASAAGLRLTDPGERAQIRAIADAKTSTLADDDLDVLRYGEWLAGLEAGFAAHHAGMVPPMKEAVEEAFAAGLVKVVFATETLALGINMPARSVVIEKLSKFTGERHEFLTPGEYTQLTGGRATRHRRARLRGRVLEPVRALRSGRVARVAAHRRSRRRSGRRTTWPPTSCAATPSSRPTTC